MPLGVFNQMENIVNINMEGVNLNDSSLYDTMDATVTSTEYNSRIISLLTGILTQTFPGNPTKQRIRIHTDRINFACPICHDSVKVNSKKRGNLILTGKHRHHYKCFNCGEFKRTDQFFSDFHINLELNIINYITNNIEEFSAQSSSKYDASFMLDLETIEKYAIDRQEFKSFFGLSEVKDTPVWSWLKNRLQFQEEKFLYNQSKNYLLILNLTRKGDILGIQKRMFSGTNRFNTFKLSNLYKLMSKSYEGTPEYMEYLDTISMLFNICLIDSSKEITLFEGPMDAFLFKNSIANCGANKNMFIDIPVRYWYDADKTGRDKSIQHLNNEESVFLWSKFLQEIGAPYKSKWDLNDIILWARKNNIKLPAFENYFSNDSFDLIDI